ncbi:unnamed protein product [Caenorhabditis sp. 36 PRJEB53466]|nr:unnamed protein product [Caenorhabditis sp. 36 PRJEB53466]
MNGGRKRRISVHFVAGSLFVLAVSVVTAQQVFDGNGQTAFVRQQQPFQPQPPFQQNRNFVLTSAPLFRHRNLFARQISHRHRTRQRSSSTVRTTTHQPSVAPLTRRVPPHIRKRIRPSSRTKPTMRANQRTTTIKSNISRRQQPPAPFQQQRQQPFRFQQQPIQRQQQPRLQPAFVRGGMPRAVAVPPNRPFALRAPLSPIPFGSVQQRRLQTARRLPQNNMRLSLRPPAPPSTPPILTTTTPLPSPPPPPPSTIPTTPSPPRLPSSNSTSIKSAGGLLRRPIIVQQLNLNLRRKPQMTRGQFRRPSSNHPFPPIRHQLTHRVKPDRVTRPIPTTTQSTTEVTTTLETIASEAVLRKVNHQKRVDDIEAAILQAVIESSSPVPPSSTHRPRRIRPGQQHRTAAPRVDSIEEAVLRAVLEANPPTAATQETTTTTEENTAVTTTEEPTTTAQKTEATSLFPAFATRRQTHRRRTTTTETPTTPEVTMTTETTTMSTEEPTTTTTTTTTTTEAPSTTSEEPTTITIAVPEEEFEDINAQTEDHQLHQIEENVIAALSTPSTPPTSPAPPPSSSSSSSPSPPAPPSIPTSSESPFSAAGPPGSMPPSDDIVDELNESSDFLQAAQRLHLLRRLLQ